MSVDDQRQTRAFGITVLVVQIIIAFMWGFFIDYSGTQNLNAYLLVIVLALLALLGFGLITTYIKQSHDISFTHIIMLFGFCLQLFFPIRGMWQLIGISQSDNPATKEGNLLSVTIVNDYTNRQLSKIIFQNSMIDAISCLISLIVAYCGVIGRVCNFQVLILAIVGTIGYELNSQLFWNWYITDCGFGMRIFLYGGTLGLITSIILGQRQTTIGHRRYSSDHLGMALAFAGAIIIFILLPILSWADLYHPQENSNPINSVDPQVNDGYIIHVSSLNLWLSLCASVIGCYLTCLMKYRKLSAHDLTFTIFTGGIAYTSISDLYFNPGVAIGIGTLVGIICCLLINVKQRMNYDGVIDSNGILITFLIPGLIAGVLSAIFHAKDPENYGSYFANKDDRNRFINGWYQVAGIAISLAVGLVGGAVNGILSRMFNMKDYKQQFSSQQFIIYKKDLNQESKID